MQFKGRLQLGHLLGIKVRSNIHMIYLENKTKYKPLSKNKGSQLLMYVANLVVEICKSILELNLILQLQVF